MLTGRDSDCPHTHNSRYPHRPLGLHQSHTHRTQRPSTVRSCSPASSCYVGPPTAMSNTLHNIHNPDWCCINQLTWTTHANDAEAGMRGGICSSKWCKPLARHWKDFSRSRCILYTWTCIFPVNSNEKSPSILYTSAYYTRDFIGI